MARIQPRTLTGKPELPKSKKNPQLETIDPVSLPVKFQVITRGDSEEIIVGRLKIPLPDNGHAFILRRFDTGAISVSTMLKAAYFNLGDDLEKKETHYVRTAYDIAGANGAGPRRLAGVWAPLDVAESLAHEYGLTKVLGPLMKAEPDEEKVPRRSTRSDVAEENASLPPSPSSPGKGSTKAKSPPPAKKRRGVATSPSPSAISDSVRTRTSARISNSPAGKTRASMSPGRTSRRSTIKSPKLAGATLEEDEADVPGPNAHEDIEEQKALVATLKAAKAAAEQNDSHVTSVAIKRTHEDETQLTLNIASNDDSLAVARPIAGNRRIPELTPNRKAAVWGAFAFTAALGAVAFLPNVF